MSPVKTTADMMLTDYQRGQLAHLRSLLEIKHDDDDDVPKRPPRKEVNEEAEYERAKTLLDEHLQRMRDQERGANNETQPEEPEIQAQPPNHRKTAAKRKASLSKEGDFDRKEKQTTKKKRIKKPDPHHDDDDSSSEQDCSSDASIIEEDDNDADEYEEHLERNITETMAMMRNARQALEDAKKELNVKQRNFDSLTAQLDEYTHTDPRVFNDEETKFSGNDETLTLLQRKVEIFRLYLEEARTKVHAAEKKSHDINLKALAAKKAKDKWMRHRSKGK